MIVRNDHETVRIGIASNQFFNEIVGLFSMAGKQDADAVDIFLNRRPSRGVRRIEHDRGVARLWVEAAAQPAQQAAPRFLQSLRANAATQDPKSMEQIVTVDEIGHGAHPKKKRGAAQGYASSSIGNGPSRPVQGMSRSLPWVAGTSPSVSGTMR